MTKPECLTLLKRIPLIYYFNGLLMSETIPFKKENYEVLNQCQSEMPELRIYRDVNKFRIIIKIN